MTTKRKKVECLNCGVKFVPYHPVNQDYCSDNCRVKAYYDRFVAEHGCTPLTYRRRMRKKAEARSKRKVVKYAKA